MALHLTSSFIAISRELSSILKSKKKPFWLLLGMGVPSIEAEEAAASSLSHACTYTFVTRPSPTPARISENLHLNLKYEILDGIATKCLRM